MTIRVDNPSNHSSAKDAGFSLIEITVTIMVIGLLIALSFPAFASVRHRSAEKAAMANARAALVAAKSHQIDKSDYTTVNEADMLAAEPTLTYTRGTNQYSTGTRVIAYYNATNYIQIAVWSPSGTCFRLYESTTQAATSSKTKQASVACVPTAVAQGSTW